MRVPRLRPFETAHDPLAMKLDYAIFGAAATVKPDGMFSLLDGGMVWLNARDFPATCPQLVLVAQLSFADSECDKDYGTVVKVYSPSEEYLAPDRSLTMRPRKSGAADSNSFIAVYHFDGFTVGMEGAYRFCIFLGEAPLGEARLHVRKAAQ